MVFDVVRGHGVDHDFDLTFDFLVKSVEEFGEDGQHAFNPGNLTHCLGVYTRDSSYAYFTCFDHFTYFDCFE